MAGERSHLEQLWRWRQVAVWAPVLWFPVAITGFAMGRSGLAVGLLLAGLMFTAICSGIIWRSRCPRCTSQYGASRTAFRRFWDDASCEPCGLSLFELRRQDSSSA